MITPPFSIVIPAFNAAPFLAEAIDSVLDQTRAHGGEVVVVDDGSTDDTSAVAQAYGDPVRCLRQVNAGPAAARNAGVLAARGELILLLDADDRAASDRVERQVAFMQAHAEIDLCFGSWTVEGESGDYLQRYGIHAPAAAFVELDEPLARLLARGSFVPTSTAAVRRSAYIDAGMQPHGSYYAEDYALWCEIAARGGRFACSGTPLAWYRTSAPGRLTRSEHTYAGHAEVLGRMVARYGYRLNPLDHAAAQKRFRQAAEILFRHEWAYGGRAKLAMRLDRFEPRLPASLRRKWKVISWIPSVLPRTARRARLWLSS